MGTADYTREAAQKEPLRTHEPGRRSERYAPPVSKKKRVRARKVAWQLVSVAIALLIAASAGYWFVGKILRPLRLSKTEDREAQSTAAEYKALKKENSSLRRQIIYLQSQQGMAEAARKLGYVKPGEISIVIPESTHPSAPKD